MADLERLGGPQVTGNGSAPAEVDLAAVAALSDGGLWARPTRSRVEPGWADCLPTLTRNRSQAIHRHPLVAVATLASAARRLWPPWTTLTAVVDSLRRDSFDVTLIASPSGHPADLLLACLLVCSIGRVLACSFARLLVCSFDGLLASSVVCLLDFLGIACFLPGLLAWELEIRSLEAD